MRTNWPAEQPNSTRTEPKSQAERPDGCSFRLPAALGIAADLGFLAALALVLAGFGAIGLWCGLLIGAASIAGVTTNALLNLPRTQRPIMQPALAMAGASSDPGRRAG